MREQQARGCTAATGAAVTGRQRKPVMTVGELSRRTAVPVKALRAYTDLGLVYTLGRSSAGYRLYDTDALWCVRFIGELRGLGLTIAEIGELTAIWSEGAGRPDSPSAGPHLAELLHRSRRRLRQRIAAQQQILDRIDQFENQHRQHLADGDLCWTGDPQCDVRA